jgi:hypothetical protein
MELSGLKTIIIPEVDEYALTRSALDFINPMIVSTAFKV